MNSTSPPLDLTHSRKAGRTESSGGEATRSVKPMRTAACTQEAHVLLESPLQATSRPLIGPLCSSNVIRSASTWQGCDSLVSPLMTGTDAFAARSMTIS